MSEENKLAGTPGFIAKVLAVFTGTAAALAALPQDAILKEGVPGVLGSLKRLATLNWLRLVEIYERLNPLVLGMARKLWRTAKLLMLASAGLIAFGVQLKEGYGSDLGHVMVALGVLTGTATLMMIWWFTDIIVAITALKLDLAKKVVGTVGGTAANLVSKVGVKFPEAQGGSTISLDALKEKVKRAFAAIPVVAFSLMFIMLFPSWSTVGWVACMWVPVVIVATSAVYLGKPFGMAIEAVLKATVAILVFLVAMFLMGRLFPKTFGEIGFGGLDAWMQARNRSEWVVMALALIPLVMLLVSVFTKDDHKKSAFRQSAKYVGVACGLLAAFLLYKGTVSWKQLSGKETEQDAVGKTVDVVHGKYMGVLRDWEKDGPPVESSSEAHIPLDRESYKGRYMAPPPVSAQPETAPSAPRTPTPRAKKPPLPPLKAKSYGDAASAIEDLESLL